MVIARKLLGWFLIALFLFAIFACDRVFPDGVEIEGPRIHQGLLIVRPGDWTGTTFEPLDLLLANEATRAAGRQKHQVVCMMPGKIGPTLDAALARSRPDVDGTRLLWVTLAASTRLRSGLCMDRFARARNNRTSYGRYLYMSAIRSARSIGCDYVTFVGNRRRCPVPSPPPALVRLRDPASFPAEALAAGVEGATTVEALIGHRNTLIQCRVTSSSGNAALDGAACPTLAAHPELHASGGSGEGLASGVRRLTKRIRWELDDMDVAGRERSPR